MRLPLRILWVTPSMPRRGRSPMQERAWSLLAHLAPRHALHLLAFVDADDRDVADGDLPPGLAEVARIDVPPDATADGRTAPALTDAIARWRPELVQLELVGPTLPPPSVPTLLTIDRLDSAEAVPAWRAGGRNPLRLPGALLDRTRARQRELAAMERAHRVVVLSPEDAARLQRLAPGRPTSVVPMGIDGTRWRPRPQVPPTGDVVFVGDFERAADVDAALFLVRDVLPRLDGPVRVRLVGADPPEAVRGLANGRRVTVADRVDDLGQELAAARVVAAPVRFGCGMRATMLATLAMARPLVTNRLGAEGLAAVDREHLLLATDAVTFAAAITRYLHDPGFAAVVGARGRALVERRFAWPVVAAAQETAWHAALDDPAPTARR